MDLQQLYNAELLQKRELRSHVESMQSEVQTLRAQVSSVNQALHKCEEYYSTSKETEVKHRVNLEAANKTIDAIKDHSTQLLVV